MVETFLIYGLIDPRSGELRYVGKTCSGLKKRLREHFSAARRGRHRHIYHWLRQLLAAGLKPDIEVLETHKTAEALAEAEKYLIAYFRMVGCRLTNLTDGGEGMVGWKHRAASRIKMSTAHTGSRLSESTRTKISAATRGANNPQWRGRIIDQYGTTYSTQREAAIICGVPQASVSKVLNSKLTHTHGYTFKYAE